ncbi:MAG: ATP-binding protein [Piscinibacter sp.]
MTATDRRDPTPPATRWRASALVAWAGVLVALLVAVVVAWLGWSEYEEKLETRRSRNELLARVLEDHATRTVETTAIAMGSLSELIASHDLAQLGEVAPLLNQALIGLPFLRSIALLDSRGKVITSTAARDLGQTVDMHTLGTWPAADRDRLGAFMAGRSLADLGGRGSAAPGGVGFIPLLRGVELRTRDAALLVALINPDAFSNHQELTLGDPLSAALLASYDGALLTSTRSAALAPASPLDAHPVFRSYLPSREHATYAGRGARGDEQLVAFRVSRSRPLVVLVEHPLADVRAQWWQGMRSVFGLALVLLLFVAASTLTAWRSLRAREATRALLDRAQAEVAERERELSVTIASVQALIFRTDPTGAISFVNERWSALGGGDAQQAIGGQLHELVLPEQREAMQSLFSPDLRVPVRHALATVPGVGASRTRHFDVTVVPLTDGRRIAGFAGSATEVTDRVVAQQKLQTQLAVSALMLEISPLPLSMLDTLGRYVSVNHAWEEFTGRRRADVIGQAAASYLPPEEALLHSAQDRELLESGGRVSYEARVTHRDGSRRDVMLIKTVVPGDDGAAAGILIVLMDVSEFRAAERATREARDAAEETSRAKTEFIANISHELRTPLQSILGFSELGMVRGRQHERLAAMFTDIHTSGKRMLALVNDLLDVSKIESTVGTMHLERTDLRALVREVAREVDPLLAGRQLTLTLSLSELPMVARVDPMRFQQVVRNVLANAIKFSPFHGRIELSGETLASGELRISVRDQGPGIPPDEIERVFEAFVQSSQTKDGSGGTGLGLAICRKILEAHGGRIHAENLAGGGTVFHIHLPARIAVETAPMPL